MKIRKPLLLLYCVLLVAIIGLALSLFFLTRRSVSAEDKSNKFDIIYTGSPLFNRYVQEWRLFDSKGTPTLNQKNYQVRSLVVVLTDVPQSQVRIKLDPNSKPHSSYKFEYGNFGQVVMTIQLDPEYYKNFSEKTLSFAVTRLVLQQLYMLTHPKEVTLKKNTQLPLDILTALNNQEQQPFDLKHQAP